MEGQRSNDGDEGETIVKVLVFPIVLYGAETWTMRKHERRKIDSFELWRWRGVLRVPWMERKTNIWIIENIKPEWTLEYRVSKATLGTCSTGIKRFFTKQIATEGFSTVFGQTRCAL